MEFSKSRSGTTSETEHISSRLWVLTKHKTMTFGRSLAEAKRMAKDLLELLVECELNAGRAIVATMMHITGRSVKTPL